MVRVSAPDGRPSRAVAEVQSGFEHEGEGTSLSPTPTHALPITQNPRSGSRQRWAYRFASRASQGGIDRPVIPTRASEQGAARGPALGAMIGKRGWGDEGVWE
jgi:hypothetical protein